MYMDRNSKVLSIFLLLLIIISVYLTYRRSFITKDYEIIIPEDVQEEEEDLSQ